jgi:hypothetical protein
VNTCRTCGARILWAISSNGRPIPVDLDPDEHGNLALVEGTGVGRLAIVRTRRELDDARLEALAAGEPEPLYHRAHFASCPDANLHRRR